MNEGSHLRGVEEPAGMEAGAVVAGKIKLKSLGTNTHKLPSSSLLLSRFPLEAIQKGFQPLMHPLTAEKKLIVGMGETGGSVETPDKESKEQREILLPLERLGQFTPPPFALLFLIDYNS